MKADKYLRSSIHRCLDSLLYTSHTPYTIWAVRACPGHIHRNSGILFQFFLAVISDFEGKLFFFKPIPPCSGIAAVMPWVKRNHDIACSRLR